MSNAFKASEGVSSHAHSGLLCSADMISGATAAKPTAESLVRPKLGARIQAPDGT